MPVREFVSIDTWTMIGQWCNLLILVLLVKKFLFKPVERIFAKRQEELDKLYSDANEASTAANEMRVDYEKHLAEAKQEAADIVSTATVNAQRRSDEIISEAQKKAAAIMEKTSAEVELERKKAVNDAKDEIGKLAVDIASKVVEKEISEEDHKKLIEEFINNVGEAS